MGAHPYFYFVPYQPDIRASLGQLRDREFRAGRYNPVVEHSPHAIDASPGAQHASIDEARQAAAEEGTRSILDLDEVSEEPEFFAVSPVSGENLQQLYGTAQPTREMVEEDAACLEGVERGHGVYVVTYQAGVPDFIYFAGYSLD